MHAPQIQEYVGTQCNLTVQNTQYHVTQIYLTHKSMLEHSAISLYKTHNTMSRRFTSPTRVCWNTVQSHCTKHTIPCHADLPHPQEYVGNTVQTHCTKHTIHVTVRTTHQNNKTFDWSEFLSELFFSKSVVH